MRVHPSILVPLAALSLCFAGAAEPEPAPDIAPIIRDYRGQIPQRMAENQIPGLAIVLVADGRVVWTEGFGSTDDDGAKPVTPDTFFSLQSNSKAFTALTVLMAVQEGTLDLDTPIAAYLPGFTIRSRFGDRPERHITLRHLLSHTAGLAHEAPVGNNYQPGTAPFEEHIRSISRTWLRYPVGQRYAYSNLGVDLAGYIVQRVTGTPFPEYASAKFLTPAGMPDSSFDIRRIRRYPSRAVGHDNYLARVPLEIPMVPAGGLYASAREMGAFLQFHLRKGRVGAAEVLDEALLDQMYAIPSPMPGQKNGYALGLYRERRHGTVSLSHSGGGFGFLSHMRWYPALGVGIAVLTNATSHGVHTSLGRDVLDSIIASRGLARKDPPVKPPPELVPDAALLRALTGSYVSERNVEWNLVQRDGRFGIQSGPGFFPLHFTSPSEAYEQDGDEIYQYRFLFDQRGKPTAIVLVDEGLIFDFNAGPGDPPGQGRPDWDHFTGRYRLLTFGTPSEMLTIQHQGGGLFANHLRLHEHSPGLFFACTGDVVDLSGPAPTVRNIPMEKIEIPLFDHLVVWAGAVILLAAGLGGLVAPLARRIQRRRLGSLPEPARRPHRLADAVAWAAGVSCLVYLGMMLFQYPMLIGYGVAWNPRFPAWMKAAYFMPAAVGSLSLLTAVLAVAAWREPAWPARQRIPYTAAALALVGCTAILFHWNLIRL